MLTLHLVGPSRQSSQTQIPTQSSQAHDHDTSSSLEKQDPIEFLTNLNASLSLISPISQKLISLYTLFDRYREGVITSTTGVNNASENGRPEVLLFLASASNLGLLSPSSQTTALAKQQLHYHHHHH
ncbi:hypothetical protein K435DRAFT_469801 [Dendrothele bispora CBS 962.96]|uniref:Uncharacterized protein n=1 Tax=Dendrothele bispora (strain CBS 962.96) TaxID=1314807 RepID=A0A4S8KZZ8_DENBC|nr:hypothetical protein K435DRAFT_469801 [Dendrothele bispora CBS 962.96]